MFNPNMHMTDLSDIMHELTVDISHMCHYPQKNQYGQFLS